MPWNYTNVNPWDDVNRGPEDEHKLQKGVSLRSSPCRVLYTYQEKECNSCRRRVLLPEAEQDCNHHHAKAETGRANGHSLLSSHSVQRKRRQSIADNEHQFHEASNQERAVPGEAYILHQYAGHI